MGLFSSVADRLVSLVVAGGGFLLLPCCLRRLRSDWLPVSIVPRRFGHSHAHAQHAAAAAKVRPKDPVHVGDSLRKFGIPLVEFLSEAGVLPGDFAPNGTVAFEIADVVPEEALFPGGGRKRYFAEQQQRLVRTIAIAAAVVPSSSNGTAATSTSTSVATNARWRPWWCSHGEWFVDTYEKPVVLLAQKGAFDAGIVVRQESRRLSPAGGQHHFHVD